MPVPKSANMNKGVIAATLMDCMAAMPWAAGRRPRAGMTNVEKAKKTPPTRPHPSAAAKVTEPNQPSKGRLTSAASVRALEDERRRAAPQAQPVDRADRGRGRDQVQDGPMAVGQAPRGLARPRGQGRRLVRASGEERQAVHVLASRSKSSQSGANRQSGGRSTRKYERRCRPG